MKRILVGICVATLGVSTAFAGDLKIDEREDVIIVEYSGSGAGKTMSIDEAAEIAQEDQARAAARQLRGQERESKESRRESSRRAKHSAAKTAEGGADGQ